MPELMWINYGAAPNKKGPVPNKVSTDPEEQLE
jgi:hypothetical protein